MARYRQAAFSNASAACLPLRRSPCCCSCCASVETVWTMNEQINQCASQLWFDQTFQHRIFARHCHNDTTRKQRKKQCTKAMHKREIPGLAKTTSTTPSSSSGAHTHSAGCIVALPRATIKGKRLPQVVGTLTRHLVRIARVVCWTVGRPTHQAAPPRNHICGKPSAPRRDTACQLALFQCHIGHCTTGQRVVLGSNDTSGVVGKTPCSGGPGDDRTPLAVDLAWFMQVGSSGGLCVCFSKGRG